LTAVLDTNVSHGTLTLNSNGSFTYIPTGNYNGSDSFTYHANDGTVDSNIVTVTITVTPENDIPMISDIPDQTIDQGQSFAMVNLDEFVSDVDNADDTLVWTYTGNTNLILTITNRVLVITASANWSGSERIYFTVTDPDGLYDQDDATFTVNPAGNTPPVISVIPDKQIEINTVAGPLTFAIGDIEDDSTALVLSKTSSNTALVPINNIVFGGSGANRTVTVTPLNNQSGATNINITVTDTAGASDNEEFVLTVNPVGNTPPVAVDDVYSVQENGVLNVSAPGRLVNDTDADGDTLIAVDYTTPSSGSLIHSEDGSFIYTPQAGVTGFVSFQYKANDGTVSSNPAIVKIYITDGGQTRGDCNVDTQVDLADVLLALQVVAGTKPLSDINIPNCNLVLVDPNVPIDMLDVLAVYDLV
jgi:VCBS repeat-containing protein